MPDVDGYMLIQQVRTLLLGRADTAIALTAASEISNSTSAAGFKSTFQANRTKGVSASNL